VAIKAEAMYDIHLMHPRRSNLRHRMFFLILRRISLMN
jgi:hypothetical protein